MAEEEKTLVIPCELLERARDDPEAKEHLDDIIFLQLLLSGKEPKWCEMSWWEWTLTVIFAFVIAPSILLGLIWQVIPTTLRCIRWLREVVIERSKKGNSNG